MGRRATEAGVARGCEDRGMDRLHISSRVCARVRVARALAQLCGPARRLRIGCMAALPLLLSTAASARPEVAIERQGDAYSVSVQVDVGSARDLVWQVLTDYDNLQRFVPGMRSSRIVSAAGQPLLLEQKGESGLLFLRVSTELTSRIIEVPKNEIRFEQVKGNLKRMAGSWKLEPHDHSTRISYRAEVEPEFALPPLIGPAVMAQNIRVMIEGVVREIERRGEASRVQPAGKTQVPKGN